MYGQRLTALAGIVLLFTAGPAAAAEGAPTPPRVRVTSPDAPSGRLVGTLVGIDEEALMVRVSKETSDVRLRRDSVTKLEVSRKRGNRGQAMIVGFLVGAAAGAVLGLSTTSNNDWFTPGEVAAGLAILGAPTGALLGLACSHGEKWETTTPDRLRVAITPTRGGVAVGVSFAF